ncbi:MAG: magnesium/cobalt transporter CorA [Candidatus Micrarchaeota archaeon]
MDSVAAKPASPALLMPEPISTTRQPTKIILIEYGGGKYAEREISDVSELSPNRSKQRMQWVSVFGLQDAGKISQLADRFGLHSATLEDILNTRRRPRLEDYNDQMFLVLKALGYDPAHDRLRREHMSMVICRGYVLTFQEKMPDDFQGVRDVLQKSRGRLKETGSDYLAYLLIDVIVDKYYGVLERIGESIHRIDSELVGNPDPAAMRHIQKLKNELIYLRRYLWPTREVLNRMRARELKLIGPRCEIYLRDIYEHVVEMMDTTETYRDVLSNMVDIYMSMVSNRINEVMKVLTIFGTIFMPLTFIVGVYGMNFKYMPELSSAWGYPAVWMVMLASAGAMLLYFRKKGWI